MLDYGTDYPYPPTESGDEVDAESISLHEVHVHDELERLRVRHEARERHDAEKRAAIELPPFDTGTVTEILARPDDPPARIDGLLPADARMTVVAQRKTGKTTLMLNLARCLLTGEDFLDRFGVRALEPGQSVAILNYEASARQLARWADDVGVPADRLLLVNLRGRRNPLDHPDDRAELVTQLREANAGLLIVDTFGRAFSGTSQNDAAEVTPWLVKLDEFAADVGVSEMVVTVHAGWDRERTRGSSGLEDWPDVIVTVVRDVDDETERYFRAEGRDVDVDEDQLVFDPRTRWLSLTGSGSRKAAAVERKLEALVDAVVAVSTEQPGINIGTLRERLREDGHKFRREDVGRAADRAVNRSRVRVETGPRGSKLHYPISPVPVVPTRPDPSPGRVPDPVRPVPSLIGDGTGQDRVEGESGEPVPWDGSAAPQPTKEDRS